jgi:hypothetical protein
MAVLGAVLQLPMDVASLGAIGQLSTANCALHRAAEPPDSELPNIRRLLVKTLLSCSSPANTDRAYLLARAFR